MLCECIDSILALSLTPAEREIVVIDDGSDVSPMNGLMQYGDDIVYLRQKNGGLSRARNKGIDVATGTFIQFIDADDRLLQTPYEHCLDIVRFNADVDIVMFDFCRTVNATTTYNDEKPMSGAEYLRHHNIHGTAWGYLFRHLMLGDLRFTPNIWHEDEEFTPQLLLRAEHVYYTSAKAYLYTLRPKSIMTSRDDVNSQQKHLNDIRGVIGRLQKLADTLNHNDRLAMQRRVAQLTMDYIYNTICLTHSRRELNSRLDELRAVGLFPLPDRDYSQKYRWFRRMTNSPLGLTMLLHTLPLLKRER